MVDIEIYSDNAIIELQNLDISNALNRVISDERWYYNRNVIKELLIAHEERRKQSNELLTDTTYNELRTLLDSIKLDIYPLNVFKDMYHYDLRYFYIFSRMRDTEIQEFLNHIGQLPIHYRETVEYYYRDGCNYAEVARRRGVSPSAISPLLKRIHRRLRWYTIERIFNRIKSGDNVLDAAILSIGKGGFGSVLRGAGVKTIGDLCKYVEEHGYFSEYASACGVSIPNMFTKCKAIGIDLEKYYIKHLVKNDPAFSDEVSVYEKALRKAEDELPNYYALPPLQREAILLIYSRGKDASGCAVHGLKIKQETEIKKGAVSGVNVSLYCDCKYNHAQMRQIRLGLEDSVDISIYNDPSLDFTVMEQIRLGLKKNLDVNIYNKKFFNADQMKQIRLGLEKGLDISRYNNSAFNAGQMEQLRLGLEKGLDISRYSDPSLLPYVMAQIRQDLLEQKDPNSMNLF